MLTLGCVCRGMGPPAGACTGGGPFCLTGSPLSLTCSGELGPPLPKEAWEADDEGRALRLGVSSFRGGVGACSEAADEVGKGASPPSNPRGS